MQSTTKTTKGHRDNGNGRIPILTPDQIVQIQDIAGQIAHQHMDTAHQSALLPILKRMETLEIHIERARQALEKLAPLRIKDRLDAAEGRLDRLNRWEERLGSLETLTEELDKTLKADPPERYQQLERRIVQLEQVMREFDRGMEKQFQNWQSFTRHFNEVKKDAQRMIVRLETEFNELRLQVSASTAEWKYHQRAVWSRVDEVRILSKTLEKDFQEVIAFSRMKLEELISGSSPWEEREIEEDRLVTGTGTCTFTEEDAPLP